MGVLTPLLPSTRAGEASSYAAPVPAPLYHKLFKFNFPFLYFDLKFRLKLMFEQRYNNHYLMSTVFVGICYDHAKRTSYHCLNHSSIIESCFIVLHSLNKGK